MNVVIKGATDWPGSTPVCDFLLKFYQKKFEKNLVVIRVPFEFRDRIGELLKFHLRGAAVENLINFDYNLEARVIWQALRQLNPQRLVLHLGGRCAIDHAWLRRIAQFQVPSQTIITVPSVWVKERVQDLFSKSVRVCLVPLPILYPFRFGAMYRARFRRSMNIPAKRPVLGFCGRMGPAKNVNRLMDLMVELHQIDSEALLILAGDFDCLSNDPKRPGAVIDGQEITLKAWRRLPQPVREKVRFMPFLEPKQLRDFYCGIDLFVSLSTFWGEDYGLTPREALLCQTPVVLSRWQAYEDIVTDPRVGHYLAVRKNRTIAISKGDIIKIGRLLLDSPKLRGEWLAKPMQSLTSASQFERNIQEFLAP